MQKQKREVKRNKHKFTLMLDKDFFNDIKSEAGKDSRSTTNYILNCVKRALVKSRELN